MIVILLSTILIVCYTFGNRLIGSPSWKRIIPKGRVVAYFLCFVSCLLLGFFGGLPIKDALILSGILGITFPICRQRSPRGSFFLRTGGRAGNWNYNTKQYDLLYDGKHSPITSWLATQMSGVNWKYQIRRADVSFSASPTGQWNKKIVKYSWAYASLHHTIILIPISFVLSATSFMFSPVLALLGVLYGVINYVSGISGPFKKEEGAAHRSELWEGLFIHGLFALLNILGSVYISKGWF